jgi:hypothetical protein
MGYKKSMCAYGSSNKTLTEAGCTVQIRYCEDMGWYHTVIAAQVREHASPSSYLSQIHTHILKLPLDSAAVIHILHMRILSP